MSLVDRFFEEARPPYIAKDIVHERLAGISFADILDRVGDDCFSPANREGRYLFYNVNALRGGKIDVIAFGQTQKAADDAIQTDLPRLLGIAD